MRLALRSLVLLIVSALAAAAVAFGAGRELATSWFPLASVIAATVSLLLFVVRGLVSGDERRGLTGELRATWQRWRLPVLWSIGLTGVIYVAVGAEIRVLTDESTLLSTALAIYLRGKAQLITMGLEFNDQYLPLSTQIPLRPVLYPLLVAATHALTGYRLANGFVVSFGGMVAAFTAVIGLSRAARISYAGYLGTLLMAGFPLIALTATSCGLEALNLGLVLVTIYSLFRFVQDPSWRRFELTLYASILAAQCRYETALLMVFVLATALLVAKSLLVSRPPLRLLLVPWLVVPMVWQRLVSSSVNGGDQVDAAFGLEYLPTNLRYAMEFFNPWGQAAYPVSSTVIIFAAAGFATIWFRALSLPRVDRNGKIKFLAMVAGYLGATLIVQCLYYMGDLREPQLMRIGVIYAAALCMLAAYMLTLIARRPPQQLLVAVLSGVIAAKGLAVAAVNEHGKTHAGYMEYKRNLAMIATYPHEGTLVIDHHPVMYVPSLYGSVNFDYANANAAQILGQADAKLLQQILVIQRLSGSEPTEPTRLSNAYELTPLLEYRTTADYTVRISSAHRRGS